MQGFALVTAPVAADLCWKRGRVWQKVLQVGDGLILSSRGGLFAFILFFYPKDSLGGKLEKLNSSRKPW